MAFKKTYMCSFTNEMKSTYTFVVPSKVSTNHFFCTVCGKDISLSHGGEMTMEKHSKTPSHNKKEHATSSTCVNNYFSSSKDDLPPSINAEVQMAMMLVQHNSFFSTSDHLTPIINTSFSAGEAGIKYSARRTKTACIINCIGDSMFKKLKGCMQKQPYSLLLDASNDKGIEKMFPITVRIYGINFNRIMTIFFDINTLMGHDASTAESLFNSVYTQLENNDISWDYCTSIGVDNMNVNIGEQNSIKSRAWLKNKRIIIVGCPCHILHNASEKAGSSFSDEVGFDIENHCVDLFYWFDKFIKRKSLLKEYNEFCDEEYADIIQNISTRWLCLEKCVSHELD